MLPSNGIKWDINCRVCLLSFMFYMNNCNGSEMLSSHLYDCCLIKIIFNSTLTIYYKLRCTLLLAPSTQAHSIDILYVALSNYVYCTKFVQIMTQSQY